jgi:hypothetical protein
VARGGRRSTHLQSAALERYRRVLYLGSRLALRHPDGRFDGVERRWRFLRAESGRAADLCALLGVPQPHCY